MKVSLTLAVSAAGLTMAAHAMRAAQTQERTPVVVELFTSEGCSSCPPADKLLTQLDQTQPITNAHVIVLSEHVDYWNGQGWKDPYSSHFFTERQQRYVNALHASDTYTPQAVIDGESEMVGNNARGLSAEIARAAKTPKTPVVMTAARTGDTVRVQLHAEGAKARGARVYLALTENEVESQVSAGENGGRKLAHTSVVRTLALAGKLADDGQLATSLNLDPTWGAKGLRLIAFLEEKHSMRIIGAAESGI